MAERPRDQIGRMQAVQIVAMLPEDIDEARRVLAYAGRLLEDFIAGPTPPEAPADPEPPRLAVVRPIVFASRDKGEA